MAPVKGDRYRQLADHADIGGYDEFEGARRFTRSTDRTAPPVSAAKKTTEGADTTITNQNGFQL